MPPHQPNEAPASGGDLGFHEDPQFPRDRNHGSNAVLPEHRLGWFSDRLASAHPVGILVSICACWVAGYVLLFFAFFALRALHIPNFSDRIFIAGSLSGSDRENIKTDLAAKRISDFRITQWSPVQIHYRVKIDQRRCGVATYELGSREEIDEVMNSHQSQAWRWELLDKDPLNYVTVQCAYKLDGFDEDFHGEATYMIERGKEPVRQVSPQDLDITAIWERWNPSSGSRRTKLSRRMQDLMFEEISAAKRTSKFSCVQTAIETLRLGALPPITASGTNRKRESISWRAAAMEYLNRVALTPEQESEIAIELTRIVESSDPGTMDEFFLSLLQASKIPNLEAVIHEASLKVGRDPAT